MSVLNALILGITQGLTEFLPISSSGHLIIVPYLLKYRAQLLVFDTTLHLGTAAALIVYFWKDLYAIFLGFVQDFVAKLFKFSQYSPQGKTALKIILGSIPAGLIGYFFEDFFVTGFRQMLTVGVFLMLGSVLMLFAELFSKRDREALTLPQGILVGLFQALALFPGVSRSGATISGGMFLGLKRKDAAKFSFLLSVPIVVVAGVFKIFSSTSLLEEISNSSLLVGFIASFLTGIVAIKFLLNFLQNHKLNLFIIYRLLLGVVLVFLSQVIA